MTGDLSWMAQGACRSLDLAPDARADVFYPNVGRVDAAAHAKIVCGRCPVCDECLEHALVHEMWGVWGGKTPRERRKLRRERGIDLARQRRPDPVVAARHERIARLHRAGWPASEIAREIGITERNVWRHIAEAP